ncbi:hypothetical protein [Hymenobacter lapidiphilus]|uniref:Uncharacterized protein n=1 Tax=Hymenobacter lapidiphilus TaxID=2608003 RepID=A0A7Y7PRG2_9BACT|nr:hypothetical protein [Hymenobacter lapidiphilus]NVO32679.1 hypothetical protein [Hymenobacter lapidiphilus]
MSLLFRRGLVVLAVLWGVLLAPAAMAQYYLDVSRQTINLPSRTVHVEQVVDGRPGKPPIGMVYRGLDNRSKLIVFRRGLEAELTDLLRQQLPARPDDHAIVLCLRQLRVGEQLNGLTEKASADLAADVYEHLPDGYHFVRSVSAYTSARALETTSLHAEHVALLLQKCLEQLTTHNWAERTAGPALTLAQLPTDVPTISATATAGAGPAILREIPRPGVYYTFEQFLANTPAPELSASTDTVAFGFGPPQARLLWLGIPRLRVKILNEKNQSQPTKQVWGFSDGRQLFVQHQKRFFPLHRHRNFFTFVGEAPPDVAYMQARATGSAAVVGGLAGALLTSGMAAGIDHSAEPMGYAVDMRTGAAGQFPNPLLPAPHRTDTAYIYMYRYADTSTAPVSFSLDNQTVGPLPVREYLEIPWPDPGQMLRLCLELPGLPCQLIIPNPAGLNYLRVTANGGATKRPICEWVSTQQGEADLNEIDRQRNTGPR